MPDLLQIDPGTWPREMKALTSKEALYAIYRARGITGPEAAGLAGYRASSPGSLARQAWNAEHRHPVAEAIVALKRHQTQQEGQHGPHQH
jgi:hypothetical protein